MTIEDHHALFDRWLADHAAILHHVAHGFATGADREDLIQELMLALWRAVPAFRGGAQATTFIYKVAHNAALTWKRRQRNYRERLTRFENLQAPAGATPTPGDRRDGEMLELVYAQIRLLPPVERSLVLLHLDGVDYATMAEIHGITATTVGARLTRLKQKLIFALQTHTHELR